jgi:uncharacterized protein (TIGR03083 family)
MDDAQRWEAVDDRRRALADLLDDLPPEAWDHPSLCEGWRVREVAAHVTTPLLGPFALAGIALRNLGGTNALIRGTGVTLARRYDADALRARVRSMVGRHRHVPGLTVHEALIDTVGHTLDIAVPLDRSVVMPPDVVADAADSVVTSLGTRRSQVFRALPLDGLRLVASDHAWSTGEGLEVSGTMTDLFLLLTGRTARVAALTGPGADRLRGVLAG